MDVLIACEFSGTVRDEFIRMKHNAISVDLLESEKPGPHIIGDCFDAIKKFQPFLVIAHPPCTFLCNSGVRWLWNRDGSRNEERWEKMIAAAEFFKRFLQIPNIKIAIENPIMHRYAREIIQKGYDQIVHPYYFGDSVQKATCLWLSGLPPLEKTNVVDRGMIYVDPKGRKHGGVHTMLAKNSYLPLMLLPKNEERWKIRSRTFQGFAKAMAEQWG